MRAGVGEGWMGVWKGLWAPLSEVASGDFTRIEPVLTLCLAMTINETDNPQQWLVPKAGVSSFLPSFHLPTRWLGGGGYPGRKLTGRSELRSFWTRL